MLLYKMFDGSLDRVDNIYFVKTTYNITTRKKSSINFVCVKGKEKGQWIKYLKKIGNKSKNKLKPKWKLIFLFVCLNISKFESNWLMTDNEKNIEIHV